MGDIKRQRKKYSRPSKPWEKERILAEAELIKEYGFKNKKELWKMESLLKDFKERAKQFVRGTNEDLKGSQELIQKLFSLGLVEADAKIDDILSLNIKQLLERRLQTIVYKKSLALTIKQARQLITHGAILVGEEAITSPSYLVKRNEEALVKINPNSKFANPDHPEMIKIKSKNSLDNEVSEIVEEKTSKAKKGETEKEELSENKQAKKSREKNTSKQDQTKKIEKVEK